LAEVVVEVVHDHVIVMSVWNIGVAYDGDAILGDGAELTAIGKERGAANVRAVTIPMNVSVNGMNAKDKAADYQRSSPHHDDMAEHGDLC
jgi:hypothetical protein